MASTKIALDVTKNRAICKTRDEEKGKKKHKLKMTNITENGKQNQNIQTDRQKVIIFRTNDSVVEGIELKIERSNSYKKNILFLVLLYFMNELTRKVFINYIRIARY